MKSSECSTAVEGGSRPFVHDLDEATLRELQQQAAARHRLPVHFRDRFLDGSGEGPELAVIPAGSFEMGSDAREFGHRPEEAPRHYVCLRHDFALGRHVITAEQFERFRAETGWYLRPDLIWARGDYPVINIRIGDAERYAAWLSEKTGQRYRLPTEAEWEYACRAGSLAPFAFGDNVSCREVHFNAAFPYVEAREKRRWFLPRCSPLMKALPVGSLPPNLWGLHEMHGNVQEFTSSPWIAHHAHANRDGTPGAAGDPKRIVVKGGSWFDPAVLARSAARLPRLRDELDVNLGFRLLRELD